MRIAALFLCILILSAILPVNAIEINPSVESRPFFCRYTLTDWTPLCVEKLRGPQGIQGEMNQTPNMTSIFVGSNWYLHNVTSDDKAGYLTLNRSMPTDGENVSTITLTEPNTEYLIMGFISHPGDPGLLALPAGERIWYTFGSVSSIAGGNSHMVIKLNRYFEDGTEQELYNLTTGDFGTGITMDTSAITTVIDQQMNETDRFSVKFYGVTESESNPEISLYYDGNTHVTKAASPILQGLMGPAGPAGPAADQTWNWTYFLNDGSRPINGTAISRNTSDSILSIRGGVNIAGKGAQISLNGANRSTNTGALILYVPNAATNGNVEVVRISGSTNTPEVFLPTLQAGAQNSALCYNSTSKNVTYNSGVTTCTASTEKNKKNKAALTQEVSLKLMNLTPYTYTLDLDGETHYGLISEEVATVFPELAAHDENGNYTGVRYEESMAVLLKGFQEQKARTDALCAKFPGTC